MPSPSDRASPNKRTAAPPPRKRGRVARFFLSIFIIGMGAALIGAIVLGTVVWSAYQTLPSYDELITRPRGQSVTIRAADGSVLAQIGPNYGQWLRYNELPPTIREAMVAVEDRRFYLHPGVDPIGIARAIQVNIQRGRNVQGGSTITQQVVKNLFLTSARTFDRKGREMILALALDAKYSKEQILELYLNRVYFGGGAFGVDAASRTFFGHSARTLSLEEAAIIAGLVKAPSRYAPSSDPRRSIGRAAVVIQTMVETERLSAADAKRVALDRVVFAPRPRENNVRYFTDWILSQVEVLTDEAVQPIDVMTTLDPRLQRAGEAAIRRNVPGGVQGALISLGYDGAVKAMVGGTDYVTTPYNRAVVAQRQPGSAFKLFVYLAALEAGHTPDDTEVDEPISFGNWSPANSNRRFVGAVTLTQAFAQSINTVAVKLADEVGFGEVARMARRLGIATPISRNPSMALGASEVTLIDLTSAYAAVSRGGAAARAYGIRQITRGDGVVLYTYAPGLPEQVVSAETAAAMTRMMAATVESGTGRAAKLDRPVAGKTGTTSDSKDGWFIGFTGDLTTGVWLGRDDAKPVPGLAGGRLPTVAWADFMRVATDGIPPTPLFGTVSETSSEPDAEVYGLDPNAEAAVNDAIAPPIADTPLEPLPPVPTLPAATPPTPPAPAQAQPRLNQQWLDQALKDGAPKQ
jgi:penicillin-binding protein 1A